MSTQRTTKNSIISNSSGSSTFEQRTTSKKDQVYDAINLGLDVVANTAEGSDILAPLKAACRTTKSILEVVQAIENNREEWSDLTRRLKEYMSTLEEQIALFETYSPADRGVNEAFSRPLIHYVEFLETMHDTVVGLKEKRRRSRLGLLKAFSRVKIDTEEIRKLNREIDDKHKQFMAALNLFTALRVQAIEWNIAILQLPAVAFVAASVHTTCLQGTRRAVLQTISDWAEDKVSDKPIFWLCDIAGSGKSTVAMSAVESWTRSGLLGGRFFFSIASSEGSTTDKFCSTIARDLVHYIPELAPQVAGAVKQNPSFMRSSLDEQFNTLVSKPIRHWQRPVVLVVDALDECKSPSQRRELVNTLSKAVQNCRNLKVFMTSRPDPIVQAVLGSLSIKAKLEDRLHNINHPDNIDDITIYVHQSLDGILSEDKRRRLVAKANGLFIWASTACRMLNSETSLTPPDITFNRLMSMDQAGAIDSLYSLVFERIDPEQCEVMYEMLGLLLAAFEPLNAEELDDILQHAGVPGSAKALVRNLGSVLTEVGTGNLIQFRHPTLVEYLRRCSAVDSRNKGHINMSKSHGQAASWCLKCFKSPTEGLRFNICQIESSFCLNRETPNLDTKISKFISRRLRYASSHWLFHVTETDNNWRSTLKTELQYIIRFPYVLYWMEILSFTGGVARALAGLRAVMAHRDIEEETRGIMNEIRRFLIAFSVPIQESAPHIYISALPFTPTRSKLHMVGITKYANTINVTRGLEKKYPRPPRAFGGHESPVSAIAFSLDGSKMASGSFDNTVRLWDTETGQPLGEPLRGHEGSVTAIAFSSDGSRIVSGSDDRTIRVWDANGGQSLGEPLQGHEGLVRAVAFSLDGLRILSGSDDN
ncbi:hypothetical protein PIIN_09227, partial [Serendipita indica DSM 11827]